MPILSSIPRKLFILLVVIALGLISGWLLIKYRPIQKEPAPVPISTSTPKSPAVSVPTSTTTNVTQETKTYRNEEWGFEFEYPQNLILKENTFRSYYSKFNLELFTPIGEKRDTSFLVNIVLPEFAERSFRGLEKITSEIIVAEVQGIKYEYEYQGFPHTTVILPFGELRMILGTGEGSKQYLNEFNQILSTFKFLKVRSMLEEILTSDIEIRSNQIAPNGIYAFAVVSKSPPTAYFLKEDEESGPHIIVNDDLVFMNLINKEKRTFDSYNLAPFSKSVYKIGRLKNLLSQADI